MAASARRGFVVNIFLPDGDPEGVRLIEKSNWSGCGLVMPRSLFPSAKHRQELDRAGVYVLVGDSGEPLPRIYVGEGDPIRTRLECHLKQKDFWTHAVAFTSKDGNLNKAHVQHLESRLVQLAKEAKRCILENNNTPQAPSLSEAAIAEVEGFLDDMLLCLPILGCGYFERPQLPVNRTVIFTIKGKGIEAKGFEISAGFVVQMGSKVVKSETASIHGYLKATRRELIEQGVLRDAGQVYEFAQDYKFSSASTAAGVVLGRSANGRQEWQTKDGRTLKSIQEADSGIGPLPED